ncbi:L-lactate dehydrogenase (quinone) large subunit LdhH [Chrysiogenes arsenatis]|uniref:L-lactate dehydrogenase (quinone) large subunit LdhH n=1 Tax=Chrysiogenes arsenatis TaxID=309797 RepID=UPI000419E8D0|nr:LUD domain-containing protein [Chrysiogenes arsenatis]
MQQERPLNERVREKLADATLAKTLRTFGTSYKVSRRNALEGMDFEKRRNQLSAAKTRTTAELMELFEQFRGNAEAAGATVYQARDAQDACEYIRQVCEKHNAKSMIKAKSMTSEEIKINDFLVKHGIEPVESDLGEWLLQLASEHPSHMVLPAIHKTRVQCARLLEKVAGEPLDDNDIEKMVKVARKALRGEYFKASVGFTGANVAVASTGTIATVTNEGNARLCATVPAAHVVLLGYEKLVPSFSEAMQVIDLLPKCATGQNISTYVTWMKGCNPASANATGKKDVHYVFLDNGRLAFHEHPRLGEALKCIRCGSCANVCPAYEMVGGHVFGHIYIGAIGLIKTALFHGDAKAREIIGLCVGCKACTTACPAGIDLQEIIFDLKGYLGDKYGVPAVKKIAFSQVVGKPAVMRTAMKVGAILQKPLLAKDGHHLRGIPFLPKEKDFRALPSVASKTFLDAYRSLKPIATVAKEKVFFYPGCAVEYFYPQMGTALVRLLRKVGIEVDVPDTSACCGLPAIASGDRASASMTIATHLSHMKNPADYSACLVLCPSCGMAMREDFPHYTETNLDHFQKASIIGQRVITLGSFLESRGIKFTVKGNLKVTYHTPCHQGRGMKQSAAPYLQALLGDSFIPLTDSDVCCGFGGSYSIDQAEISAGILRKKTEYIADSKADIVVTDCPGCVMQIDGGLRRQGWNGKVMHLSELLDEYVTAVQ